jgi:hypothetical protein
MCRRFDPAPVHFFWVTVTQPPTQRDWEGFSTASLILTESEDPFLFDGQIGGNQPQIPGAQLAASPSTTRQGSVRRPIA